MSLDELFLDELESEVESTGTFSCSCVVGWLARLIPQRLVHSSRARERLSGICAVKGQAMHLERDVKDANQFGDLLDLGLVDPKGGGNNVSGQTKDCETKERVSNGSRSDKREDEIRTSLGAKTKRKR